MSLKISQLAQATTIFPSDIIPFNNQGVTKSMTIAALQLAIQGAGFQLYFLAPNNVNPLAAALATGLAGSTSYATIHMALVPKGAGGLLLDVPDNTAVGGNVRGVNCVDLQSIRALNSQVVSGAQSTIGGGQNNTNSGTTSVLGGGLGNQLLTSTNATIGGGSLNVMTNLNNNGVISGGLSNVQGSGAVSDVIAGGTNNTQNGQQQVCGGGTNNLQSISAGWSIIPGGQWATDRNVAGVFTWASARFATQGDAQIGQFQLKKLTANATPAVMSTDGGGAIVNNQMVLPNNSTYLFFGRIVARDTGTGNSASWSIVGLIKRGASAATTAMVGASPTVTALFNDAGFTGSAPAVTADTTNGCMAITVTGAAATNIRWQSMIQSYEVTN